MAPSRTLGLLLGLAPALLACGGPAYEYPDTLAPQAPVALAPRALTWTTPITAETLGEVPDPLAEGKNLLDIVSSRDIVRPDGKFCSECHYEGSEVPYRPAIAQYADDLIGPYDEVDGRTWDGAGGWAERFAALDEHAHFEKPAYIRALFAKWLDDGCAAKERLLWDTPITLQTVGMDPDEHVAGGRLVDVINNRVSARPDGKLCSECHYPGSAAAYRPPVDLDHAHDIQPDTVVDGRPWSGNDGWAARFIAHGPGAETEKPAYVRELFQVWLDDGGR